MPGMRLPNAFPLDATTAVPRNPAAPGHAHEPRARAWVVGPPSVRFGGEEGRDVALGRLQPEGRGDERLERGTVRCAFASWRTPLQRSGTDEQHDQAAATPSSSACRFWRWS